jgi:hypothetical protein
MTNYSISILLKARTAVFNCTNIVCGFEQTGIWPFNQDILDFMQKCHKAQQSDSAKSPSSHSPGPHNPKLPSRPPLPSTPERHDCEATIQSFEDLANSPPLTLTPSHVMEVAHNLHNELVQAHTRQAIQSERIFELHQMEQGCNKRD